jgi:predicted RNA-binding Zn-ribbon protein involved in translation (DUF1610 family)
VKFSEIFRTTYVDGLKMICPTCGLDLEKVKVKVAGAKKHAISRQCPACDFFDFEPSSARQVSRELKLSTLSKKS